MRGRGVSGCAARSLRHLVQRNALEAPTGAPEAAARHGTTRRNAPRGGKTTEKEKAARLDVGRRVSTGGMYTSSAKRPIKQVSREMFKQR
jgi:hypothetical protein